MLCEGAVAAGVDSHEELPHSVPPTPSWDYIFCLCRLCLGSTPTLLLNVVKHLSTLCPFHSMCAIISHMFSGAYPHSISDPADFILSFLFKLNRQSGPFLPLIAPTLFEVLCLDPLHSRKVYTYTLLWAEGYRPPSAL